MAKVLTTASTVSCDHQGTVGTAGQAKLKVSGSPVLRLDGITGKSVGNCLTVTDANTSTLQCSTVASASGAASKLKVGGTGVALDSLSGKTNGTPPPSGASISATANQSKLKAV